MQKCEMIRQDQSFRHRVCQGIQKYNLITPGDTVVVAVSGGVDSMVLLDVLCRLDELRVNLIVAHLNHLLRGAESDHDEAFVRRAAVRYGLRCVVDRVDVRAASRRDRMSLEETGRVAREHFLQKVISTSGAVSAALAHHRDDQAETVLMRLIRGSGLVGLSGMQPRSEWKIRPFLDMCRSEILSYATASGIEYREDRSNADTQYLRNRIRHELLPALTVYNPNIRQTLATTAAILTSDEAELSRSADEKFRLSATILSGEIFLPVRDLAQESDALRFRLYRLAIRELSGDLRSISYRHLQDIDRIVFKQSPSASVILPRGIRVGRVYGSLRFSMDTRQTGRSEHTLIHGVGSYPLHDGTVMVIAETSLPFLPGKLSPSLILLDSEMAPFPWTVRTCQVGDRMVPYGMAGSKKLKDLFVDMKVPRHKRRDVPLLCNVEGQILAVCGLRRSALAAISSATRCALSVTIHTAAGQDDSVDRVFTGRGGGVG